jgi:Mg2+ and Co2+ transporter CorA
VAHFGAVRRSTGALEEGLEPQDIARPISEEGAVGWLDLEAPVNREILSGLLESYLSQASNRTNAVMKRLTVLATIGLPFTVVSGYFGMNFEVMPWLKSEWGIIAATLLMVGISGGVLLFFKRSGWL